MADLTTRYVGRDRRGAGRSGVLRDVDVWEFVERCRRNGWTEVRVMRGEHQVGGIERTPEGRFTYQVWAEHGS